MLRNRLIVAVVLGLFLGGSVSNSLVRSKVTPNTRHYTVLLWSFPIYEEDQPERETGDGRIDATLREPLVAEILRLGVVLLFVGSGAFTAYRFGYPLLFWVLLVLVLSLSAPNTLVQSSWFRGSGNVVVEVLWFRVYEADNGLGMNNEDVLNNALFREPMVAFLWRVAVALLLIGVGVVVPFVFGRRGRQASHAGIGASMPTVG